MRRILSTFALLTALAMSAAAAQQGESQRLYQDGSLQGLQENLDRYLNSEPVTKILTPGEFVEWKLKLAKDQVLVADATSDAFDPAMEIVDADGKVLTENDDRYPGDQRPLLFWRCSHEGEYGLRVRCVHNKSGGEFTARFQTYDSIDLSSGQKVEKRIDGGSNILLRVPMKSGEVKEIFSGADTDSHFVRIAGLQIISPSGLPDIRLCSALAPITKRTFFVAPVAGDYYVLERLFAGRGTVQAWTREIVPKMPEKLSEGFAFQAPAGSPAIFELPVKAGDLVEASTPGLDLSSQLLLTEKPGFSKWAGSKPETDPFYPSSKNAPAEPGPAVDLLPARARDGRVLVFRARRDTALWLGSNGQGAEGATFTMRAGLAALELAADRPAQGKLKIANTDYWSFSANAGDVMTLSSAASGFDQAMIVRDPDLKEIRRIEASPDQSSDSLRMIVQRPGKYLVSVSCLGDGGGGDYTLSRQVFHAKEFGMGAPAKGAISDGQVQIWKFTATPSNPLLVHWSSSNWSYEVAIYDDKGNRADFQRQDIDEHNRLGILKVTKPQTFVIALTGNRAKADYSIDLSDVSSFARNAR